MRKEELRRLKRINATPKMVQMAKNNRQKMRYKYKYGQTSYLEKETKYDLLVRCQTSGKYLMVCVFLPEDLAKGERTPTYEIYCNPEEGEYITRILIKGREQKWSHAMVGNLGQIGWVLNNFQWYTGIERRIWQNPEEKNTIRNTLKTKENGILGLMEWQQDRRKRRIEDAEAREQAPWDADMKLVPKILPSFDEWMKREVSPEHFIFYEYQGKKTDMGYCSRCGKMVSVTKPRHNAKGICKNCKADITFKAAGKVQSLTTSEYTGTCIQRIKGGIVVRNFRQRQWYRDTDYFHPKSFLHETARVLIMDDGKVRRYYWGLYKNKTHRFIMDKNYTPKAEPYYIRRAEKLYKRNLASLKKTVLKHSTIDLWDMLPINTTAYLEIEKTNPALEKLARIGMFQLAEDIVKDSTSCMQMINKNATELARILKIDRQRLKRLKNMDGGIHHLAWLQYEKIINRILPDEMIKDFALNMLGCRSFSFLPVPLSFVKIWNYLKKQQTMCGMTMWQINNTWRDYINMAEKAGMDTKIAMIQYPKDLQAAHQEVIMILQQGEMEKEAKKLEKKWTKVNGQLKKLQKYEYTDGKFSIVAPKGIIDIVREGRILQHCVHTCDFYFDRIQRDESYLFFLRRAEHDTIPWYTLEVEPNGNIRQKRTTGDNQNKDFEEAVKFLKKWQKEFVRRMSREEKELGIKADQARIREYAKLREDGNKVWHGSLAGKLLADVLEADFMAAVP